MARFRYSSLPAWLRLLRPEQWTKNGVVLAALFFAYFDPSQGLGGRALFRPVLTAFAATGLFCLVSSGIYCFNDWRDREADRQHPEKRKRPIASGEVSTKQALATSFLLVAAGLAASFCLSWRFGAVVATYVGLQLAYSLGLKHIPLLDVFLIASGFVLRAMAGAAVLHVRISPWLLLCTFLLALFLALCKRRQELVGGVKEGQRRALEGYNAALLDLLIGIAAASTIVTYALYTLSPDTVARFNTHALALSIPFVAFGIFRYLFLVFAARGGERPEITLVTDRVLVTTVLLYGAVVLAAFVSSR